VTVPHLQVVLYFQLLLQELPFRTANIPASPCTLYVALQFSLTT
jgi:hypothetical protein